MTAIQQNLEAASEKYSSTFDKGTLALPPAKKYLVLTCMDARIDPAAAFGIELGDAHVIRNVSTALLNGVKSQGN
jgi:carbonic anhydrase